MKTYTAAWLSVLIHAIVTTKAMSKFDSECQNYEYDNHKFPALGIKYNRILVNLNDHRYDEHQKQPDSSSRERSHSRVVLACT